MGTRSAAMASAAKSRSPRSCPALSSAAWQLLARLAAKVRATAVAFPCTDAQPAAVAHLQHETHCQHVHCIDAPSCLRTYRSIASKALNLQSALQGKMLWAQSAKPMPSMWTFQGIQCHPARTLSHPKPTVGSQTPTIGSQLQSRTHPRRQSASATQPACMRLHLRNPSTAPTR